MARQEKLLDVDEEKGKAGGPVYQGVCAQIRALFPLGMADSGHAAKCACEQCEDTRTRKAAASGWIAAARSLAASIDRVSGHTSPAHQASGVSLSALHAQLGTYLEALSPESGRDAFEEWLTDLDKEEPADGRAQAPHPPL